MYILHNHCKYSACAIFKKAFHRQIYSVFGSARNGFLSSIESSFHTTSPPQSLDKDVRNKKSILRSSLESKMIDTTGTKESAATETKDPMDGAIDSGILIPTPATFDMLVEGVPFKNLPVVFIRSSKNNTIVTVTNDARDKILYRTSCGMEGFRNVKKSTTVAAQTTGTSAGITASKLGLTNVRVCVRGIGSGRLPAIKGLLLGGLKIVSITDQTLTPSNGDKPRKQRRT